MKPVDFIDIFFLEIELSLWSNPASFGGQLFDKEVVVSEHISAGQRVLHLSSGYYGIVLATAFAGFSLVVFDGEEKAVEVRQSELMTL